MYEKEEPWFKIYNKLNIPKEINIDDNENLLTFLKIHFTLASFNMYSNSVGVYKGFNGTTFIPARKIEIIATGIWMMFGI